MLQTRASVAGGSLDWNFKVRAMIKSYIVGVLVFRKEKQLRKCR